MRPTADPIRAALTAVEMIEPARPRRRFKGGISKRITRISRFVAMIYVKKCGRTKVIDSKKGGG